jgi:hypothetical protein
MVNCALTLAGPLPPMDVETVRVEMEKIYADTVYAMKSQDAEWWEKTSAQAWLRFLEVSQKFSCPPASRRFSISDLVCLRRHRHAAEQGHRYLQEWETYKRQAGREARQRVQKSMQARRRGPTDMDYLQMEEFGDVVTQFFFRCSETSRIRSSTSGISSERSLTSRRW